eukprot:jgi/Botrbrau1/12160/Bobra.0186s0071.1
MTSLGVLFDDASWLAFPATHGSVPHVLVAQFKVPAQALACLGEVAWIDTAHRNLQALVEHSAGCCCGAWIERNGGAAEDSLPRALSHPGNETFHIVVQTARSHYI